MSKSAFANTVAALAKDEKYQEYLDQFRHPAIQFAERVIAANDDDYIDQEELKVSRDMIVDFLAVSEETITEDDEAGSHANNSYIHYLGVNWQVTERPWWLPTNYAPMEVFSNWDGADRSGGGIFAGAAATLAANGRLQWDHWKEWLFQPHDTLRVRVSAPLVSYNIPESVTLAFDFVGAGLKSGLRRSFQIDGINFANFGPGGVPHAQVYSNARNCDNLGDEPFVMTKMGIVSPYDAARGDPPNDTRLLNHIRAKVTPSLGDSWSQVDVPLAFYGTHMSVPHRVAYHRPPGGPILLQAGQSVAFHIWNLTNGGIAQAINVQVALIGRVAPGIGSIL